jgi:hypothetical protein
MSGNVINLRQIFSDVSNFYNSGKQNDLLKVPIVFPIQTIYINVNIKRGATVFETFRYVVRQVKVYRDSLVRIDYNGVNAQTYITDKESSNDYLTFLNTQNNVINNLILQRQNE